MAMVFSRQRFDFVRKTTIEKLKNIYSKNSNTVKSTSFCLNVLFRHLKEQGYIQVFHDNNRDFKSRTLFDGGDRCPVALFKSFVVRRPLLKHPCDGLFFFSTSVADETEILNIWLKLNQTITNIVKVSVAGTSLKKVRKKFRNRRARKTTMSKLKKAMIVSSGHRGINFLNDYDEADEEERQ